MDTQIIKIDSKNIDNHKIRQAGKIINMGGLVAFPTETVYGLGADGLNENAVKDIFKAKGRPSDNPLILHIFDIMQLSLLTDEFNEDTEKAITNFWPGPLTLIFKKSTKVPDIVTAGLDTVAVRQPTHPIAQRFIEFSYTPIAAPSANVSGKPSPTKFSHVFEDLNGKVDAIIDGGQTNVGLESTVLDTTSDIPTILRPGGITYEQIREVLPNVQIAKGVKEQLLSKDIPKSPGMKYKHYSPEAEIIVVYGEERAVIEKINKLIAKEQKVGKKVGVVAFEKNKLYYNNVKKCYDLGKSEQLDFAAANIFDILRESDKDNMDMLLVEGIRGEGLGLAIRNRLDKAAGYNIIYV